MLNACIIHLRRRKQVTKGFTLIELLVVIAIIAILGAIATPSLFGQQNKAKQVDAKSAIKDINDAQTRYRTDNISFSSNLDDLGLGIDNPTANYLYEIVGTADTATVIATARDTALKGYSGGVVRFQSSNGVSAIAGIRCEAKATGTSTPLPPTLDPKQNTPSSAAQCDTSQVKL